MPEQTTEQKLDQVMNLLKNMRGAQKEYFARRRSSALEKSKALERQADTLIKDYFDPQTNLF